MKKNLSRTYFKERKSKIYKTYEILKFFKVLVLQMFNKYILKEKSNNTIASTDLHDCLVFLNCV